MRKSVSLFLAMFALTFCLTSHATDCTDLYTGSVVMDKYRNGEVKPLKSVDKIGKHFGDSASLDTVMLKKDFIENKSLNTSDLSLSVLLKSGKLEIKKYLYSKLSPWKEDPSYFSFSEFDLEKIKTDVISHREPAGSKLLVTHVEIILLNAKKEMCRKSLEIDTH